MARLRELTVPTRPEPDETKVCCRVHPPLPPPSATVHSSFTSQFLACSSMEFALVKHGLTGKVTGIPSTSTHPVVCQTRLIDRDIDVIPRTPPIHLDERTLDFKTSTLIN
ncbi:hypothetical protein CBL_00221 [Carabus blaptoides fortunei]